MKRSLFVALAAALISVPVAGAASRPLPPGGVYTCGWIAANPAAAAQAGVSCDPSGPPASSGPAADSPLAVDASGCQYLPHGGGNVGQGVYAWTSYEYANMWDWSPSRTQFFTWYLQLTNGTNQYWGNDNGYGSIHIGANVRRWGAQNHGPYSMHWSVCYDVV